MGCPDATAAAQARPTKWDSTSSSGKEEEVLLLRSVRAMARWYAACGVVVGGG